MKHLLIGWYHETSLTETKRIFFYHPRKHEMVKGCSGLYGPFTCWKAAKSHATGIWRERRLTALGQIRQLKYLRKGE